MYFQSRYVHRVVRNLPVYENMDDAVRHRIVCYPDRKGFNTSKLLKMQLEYPDNDISFVSYKNECILSVYDNRGCDIVFSCPEAMVHFYPALEPYFLDYDRVEMINRLANAASGRC